MKRPVSKDLNEFLKPFPDRVRETALFLRRFVLDLYPDCHELIYDNYNALAVGFSVSERAGDAFCSIAVYSGHVNFGLNRGAEIGDPLRRFAGSGSLYRRIRVDSRKEFPQAYARRMVNRAYRHAIDRLKGKGRTGRGVTVTKSVSSRKRRPG